MTKRLLTGVLTVMLIAGFSTSVEAQRTKKDKKGEQVTPPPKPKPKPGEIQPYSKVITKDTKTDEGLFKVHFQDEKYLD